MSVEFGSVFSLARDQAIGSTAILAMAIGGHLALGRRRATVRSSLWDACLVGLLILPVASIALPRLRVEIPTAPLAIDPVREVIPLRVEAPPPEPVSMVVARPAPAASHAEPIEAPVVAWRPDWIELALGVYLIAAVLRGIGLAVAMSGLGRLRRRCRSIDDPRWVEALDRWGGRLGIGRRVDLLATNQISVPIAAGWLRPSIVIPEGLVGTFDPEAIDAVLLHELAHVRRGDFGWNLALKLVQILYWPHPMVWMAGRMMAGVREQVCDDLCVHVLGGSEAYRATLIEVASGLVRRPGPSIGMAMARGPGLVRRLDWIDRTRGESRCLSRWPARLAIGLTMIVAAGLLGTVEVSRGSAQSDEPPAKPKEATTPRTIDVIVRDRVTGKPIVGARVRPTINLEESIRQTDREGRSRIVLFRHGPTERLNLDVWAEGYVQQRHYFSQTGSRYPRIPDHLIVELLPGEQTLGGTVRDEEGRPIPGVKVVVWGYLVEKKQKEELAYMVDATTDDQGQWRCRCFRSMKFGYLYLTHPEYVSDDDLHPRAHGSPDPNGPVRPDDLPLQSLLDFSDVQIMIRGVTVSGEVRDEAGDPIEGAEVEWIDAAMKQMFHSEVARTTTDRNGQFRFEHVRPGGVALQFRARGHAPDVKTIEVRRVARPIGITLGPAQRLEGRVVDTAGRPIPGATVKVDTPHVLRTMGTRHFETDADGWFRWEDAPADGILLDVGCRGFVGVSEKVVRAGEDITVTLSRAVSVSGKIQDALTKKLIDRAEVEVGFNDPKTGKLTWERTTGGFAMQGEFRAEIAVERLAEFRLRVTAKGYEPAESRVFHAGEVQVEYDFSLKPAEKSAAREVLGTG